MNEHLLNAALAAAERGWRVFPLRPGTKRPALHGEASCTRTGPCAGGHRKWEQRATTDPERIRSTWSRGPFNVGIATGPSGLLVVDLDVPKNNSNKGAPGGAATFRALCERTGHAVPDTYRTRTASGGGHLYFTASAGCGCPTRQEPSPRWSTPGHGADTSSPRAVPPPPDPTKPPAAPWRPRCRRGC